MGVNFSSHTLIHDDGVNGLSGEQFDAIAAKFAPQISDILDSRFLKTGAGFELLDGASDEIAKFMFGEGMGLASAIVTASTGKPPGNIFVLIPTLWLVLERTFPGATLAEMGNAIVTRMILLAGRQSAAATGNLTRN